MPEALAAIRPDDQSFALLLHLVGATVVVGALLASATSLALARSEIPLLRRGYFSLLFVGLPGLILMRLARDWLNRLQTGTTFDPDRGARLARHWIRRRRLGRSALPPCARTLRGRRLPAAQRQGDTGLLKATMVIALILIVAYVVAVWAMTGKPN